uniref:Ubiquitin carboxyl-terminal hydrolase n=1 Tax=Ciona savignyi TaxID=51511 RepID=H2Z744_CIOSA
QLSICNCKHILRMTVGERHSVVNPQHWLCNVCYTTESVWACLSCPNVACGRYIHEHALNHYIETQHPLSIDVNELYVYCYACEKYVLNDNKAGDIKVLRETLQAIRYQNFTGTTRSGHTLRTATISADEDIQMRRRMQQQQLDRDDRNFTAIWHSSEKRFTTGCIIASSTNNSPECNRVRHESIRLREFAISDVKSEEECEVSSATANKDLLSSFNDVEKSVDLNSSAEKTAFGIDNMDLPAPVQTSPQNHANNSILNSVEKFELIEHVHNSKLNKLNSAVTSLIPGVTGLRNLGNTCYLNSIIQVLGHLQKFRLCLLAARDLEGKNDPFNDDHPHIVSHHRRVPGRRSTMEIYENQTHVSRRMLRLQSGLNGGHEDSVAREKEPVLPSAQLPPALSLCQELNDLYHIMWSGKWKLVSPCHFLSSVWQLIPSFRGYSQQDAQEFLCELLDKIVSELERKKRRPSMLISNGLASQISKVVHAVFEGNLHSKVKCLECCHISSTIEPFWDLSLEFPPRYHVSANNWKNTSQGCSLSEMLEKFTEEEQLDGGQVYNCARCNHFDQGYRKAPQKFTEAVKQIKISKLPQILRFHLKRFRWSGRNHREKITVPVHFPSELDIREHCWLDDQVALSGSDGTFMYDLSAVVIHHGRGFGSGHYTAYCWNDIGKFWVHCNDSNLELCSIDDVMAAQAYILFYTQR